ncbi:MAG: alpha/beta family hydrolase [Rhodanobacteraceae bacterium]
MSQSRPLAIALGAGQQVSGLMQSPPQARACLVLAHGAGAGMEHPFMAAVAQGLAVRGIATLRYQFPYMQRGSKRRDTPNVAHAAVRAAVAEAQRQVPALPLFAGGKSFGARMTSQAQAAKPLPAVRGLAFLGFPLHPAGKLSDQRATHLIEVTLPMLFMQGSRDGLARLDLLRPLIQRLGARATLHVIEDADHSFHVPVRSGRTDAEVMDDVLDVVARWIAAHVQ